MIENLAEDSQRLLSEMGFLIWEFTKALLCGVSLIAHWLSHIHENSGAGEEIRNFCCRLVEYGGEKSGAGLNIISKPIATEAIDVGVTIPIIIPWTVEHFQQIFEDEKSSAGVC